jgi:hypothetical protein
MKSIKKNLHMYPEMSNKNYHVCVTSVKYILQVKWSKDIFLGKWTPRCHCHTQDICFWSVGVSGVLVSAKNLGGSVFRVQKRIYKYGNVRFFK